jgi:hypothetical protein
VSTIFSLSQYSAWLLREEIETRLKKEIKRIQIGNEQAKVSLFPEDMILYLKDPKDSTKNILTSNKHFWQSRRIQNQHTKISKFSMYPWWTGWERNQKKIHSQ